MAGPDRSSHGYAGQPLQSPTQSSIDHYKFRLFQHNTASMPYFGTFLFPFHSVSSIQVPLQWQQVATAVITVAELLLLGGIVQNN